MAQDIGLDNTAGPTVSTFIGSDITDTNSSALTSSVDFNNPMPLEVGYEAKIVCATSADSYAFIQVAWSHDDTDFSDTSNLETIATVDGTASTTVIKCGSFAVRARYAKFRVKNETGGTITASGSTLVLTDLFGDQA